MAPESKDLTSKVNSGSPYQLEKTQTLKASAALLKHIKSEASRKDTSSTTKNLLADQNDSSEDASLTIEPIWLVLTTKKHIVDQKRLKPGKILLPHPINTLPTTTICLFTADPQRPFKDTVADPSFPGSLSKRITRVLGISKLKARYKSFESRRQLLADHDIFLADARIITLLPNILGKTFYKSGSKRPVPVDLEPSKPRDPASGKRVSAPKPKDADDRTIAPPVQVAREIERTLSCAQVYLSPAATTAVRIGLASFTPEQVAENVEAVVNGMVEKFVTKKWRNVRAVHIKGPNTMALPIWLAEELWVEEEDVLEDEEARLRIEAGKQAGKRKGREAKEGEDGVKDGAAANGEEKKKKKKKQKEPTEGKANGGTFAPVDEVQAGKKRKLAVDDDLSAEMKDRRAKLRKQKEELRAGVVGQKRKSDVDGEVTVVQKVKKPKVKSTGGGDTS